MKKPPICKDKGKIEKIFTLIDILIVIMVVLATIEYFGVVYSHPEYLIANQNSEFTGKPIKCVFENDSRCDKFKEWIYPKEMYVKEYNPRVYWFIEYQGVLVEIILLYLVISRWKLIKKFWEKIK